MEIKSVKIENEKAIIVATIPKQCCGCKFCYIDEKEEFEVCYLAYTLDGEKNNPKDYMVDSDWDWDFEYPKFCPFRCNNG